MKVTMKPVETVPFNLIPLGDPFKFDGGFFIKIGAAVALRYSSVSGSSTVRKSFVAESSVLPLPKTKLEFIE